ncbi:MAG: hypothetical protein KDA54_20090 [Phycisphaerales bacterium]|nr:hypothetical protein [Phycisphaerales bacterium]
MDKPHCWRCRYYVPNEDDYPNWEQDQRSGCGQGTCNRHAPTPQKPDQDERVVHYGYWPVVFSGDWCGEFAPRSAESRRKPQWGQFGDPP